MGRASKVRLPHIEGGRFLCASWVLCGRYLPDVNAGIWLIGKYRLNAAADVFVVLSGFAMYWTFAEQQLKTPSQLGRFFLRRLGRVLLGVWLSMAWSLVIDALESETQGITWQLLRCSLLVEGWVFGGSMELCPNKGLTTLAELIPCWLFFPVLCCAFSSIETAVGKKILVAFVWCAWTLLGVLSFAAAPGFSAFALYQGSSFRALPDFVLGASAALAAARTGSGSEEVAQTWRGCLGHLADVAAALLAAVVTFTPLSSPKQHPSLKQPESIFEHLPAPMVVVFLIGSGEGRVARLLRHKSLTGLAAYCFQVYVFQEPLFRTVRYFVPNMSQSAEGFVFFYLLLWLLSGLYVEFIEEPLMAWLRCREDAAHSSGH